MDWELNPGTLVLTSQYSHINNQDRRITWQEAERKLDCLPFQVRLIWTQSEFFQVIWKHPALKLEQRVSPSDNFPLEAKRNQEETNYECMQNKPKLLFKFKKC